MVRLGQKAKKFGAIGLKVAGTGLSVYGSFKAGQKMGDMSDNASMDNFNRKQDALQARSRATYLAGESRFGAPDKYVRNPSREAF